LYDNKPLAQIQIDGQCVEECICINESL